VNRADSRTIVAIGGSGAPGGPLNRHLVGLAGKERPRVCFLPTAVGDSSAAIELFYERFPAELGERSHVKLFGVPQADVREHLLAQDVIYVSGGNSANMLAVWRVHGVDATLREAWEAGIVLCGPSAGGLCWFEDAVTDSFGPELRRLGDGLGFLGGSFCPHYDSEPQRRPTLHRLLAEGLSPAVAADDGVGVRFSGRELAEVVSEAPEARAYRVEVVDGAVRETPLETRLLVASS
jgi:dipeptidase E